MRKQLCSGPTTRVRHGSYWTISVAAALAVAALLLLSDDSSSAQAQTTSAVLVGAGDIASCDSTGDTATSKLLGSIAGTVLTIGDNAYKEGTLSQYNNCYGPPPGDSSRRVPSQRLVTTSTVPRGRGATSTTSARPPVSEEKATTPTIGAPGTLSYLTQSADTGRRVS